MSPRKITAIDLVVPEGKTLQLARATKMATRLAAPIRLATPQDWLAGGLVRSAEHPGAMLEVAWNANAAKLQRQRDGLVACESTSRFVRDDDIRLGVLLAQAGATGRAGTHAADGADSECFDFGRFEGNVTARCGSRGGPGRRRQGRRRRAR